jgi:hypothetical protein
VVDKKNGIENISSTHMNKYTRYIYDNSNGCLSREEVYNNYDLVRKTRYTYTKFDTKNNWIERITTNELIEDQSNKNQDIFIEKRIIEYY